MNAIAEIIRLNHECEQSMAEIARLRADNERLTALIKRHDVTWKRLHPREYTGPLRDDTRAALAADGKAANHPLGDSRPPVSGKA